MPWRSMRRRRAKREGKQCWHHPVAKFRILFANCFPLSPFKSLCSHTISNLITLSLCVYSKSTSGAKWHSLIPSRRPFSMWSLILSGNLSGGLLRFALLNVNAFLIWGYCLEYAVHVVLYARETAHFTLRCCRFVISAGHQANPSIPPACRRQPRQAP
jgi:hypothetical protein